MTDTRTFVYQIVSQSKQSNYAHSQHVSEEKYGRYHVYGTYGTMETAVKELAEIYDKQILGVKFDTEYHILKRVVR